MSGKLQHPQTSLEATTRNREPLHVSYAREFEQVDLKTSESGNQHGWNHAINRFVVYYVGAYICNLDLGASSSKDNKESDDDSELCSGDDDNNSRQQGRAAAAKTTFCSLRRYLRSGSRPRRSSEWRRNLRFGWFPRTLIACFVALCIYLFIAAYFQYVYDFDLLRLLRLRRDRESRLNSWDDSTAEVATAAAAAAAKEIKVVARMTKTRAHLDLLGANYCHLPIIVECLYMLVAGRSLLYLSSLMHYRSHNFMDHHIVRDLLDRRQERFNIARMVQRQVARFLHSSRVHHHHDWGRTGEQVAAPVMINLDTGREIHQQQRQDHHHADRRTPEIFCDESYQEISLLVRAMVASNALNPLYMMRAWARKRALSLNVIYVLFAANLILFDLSLAYGFFSLAGLEKFGQTSKNSSLVVQVVCFVLLFTTIPAIIMHGALFMTSATDQTYYVEQLCKMIKLCIRQNSLQFLEVILKQSRGQALMFPISTSSSSSSFRRRPSERISKNLQSDLKLAEARRVDYLARAQRIINSNLIFTLLHYKIFVAQLAPTKRSIGFYNVVAYVLLFMTPLIARFYEPYISEVSIGRFSGSEIKIFVMVISVAVLPLHSFACWPLCVMLARCRHLYKDLSSLLAHTSEVRSYECGEHVYDSHAELCLMRELRDPNKLLGRLTISFGGVAATHTTLMKAYFWYGLIIISILVDGNSAQGLFGWFFSDPMRVFT